MFTGDFQNNFSLQSRRVAMLATQGVEPVQLIVMQDYLQKVGASAVLVAPYTGTVQGISLLPGNEETGALPLTETPVPFSVDTPLNEARPTDFDALYLPGGLLNPDLLRQLPEALDFVQAFFAAAKPVATLCHGAWTLIDAGVVRGRTLTAWPSLREDLENAGANWCHRAVVVDEGCASLPRHQNESLSNSRPVSPLITARGSDDLAAFIRAFLVVLAMTTPDPLQQTSRKL